MAELEQLQEMTQNLGNFTFQIHCTTYIPTQWKMKFALLFTFIIKIHFLTLQMCSCPFWNRVDSFPHTETTTTLVPQGILHVKVSLGTI